MRKIGLLIFACLSLLAHITVAAVFLKPSDEVMEEAGQGETALEMGTLFDSTASKAVEPETLPERQLASRTLPATEPHRAIPIKAFNQQHVTPRPVEPRQAEAEALPEKLAETPDIQDADIVKPREAQTAANSAKPVPPAAIKEANAARHEEVTPTTAPEIAPPRSEPARSEQPKTIEAVDSALASMPRSRPPALVKAMEQQREIERQKAQERAATKMAHQAQAASRASKAARKGGATTNARGKKAATGGTGGKTKAANGDALTSNYKGKVRARLRRSLVYPRAAQQRRETGTATVRFSIAANGRATAISLVKSSGRTRLDKAALATVKRASPFPPLPSGTRRSAITMTVPIVFRM